MRSIKIRKGENHVSRKNKKDVKHIHVDFVYVMEAEELEVKAQIEEISKIAWLTKDEVLLSDCFDSVKGFVKNYLKTNYLENNAKSSRHRNW